VKRTFAINVLVLCLLVGVVELAGQAYFLWTYGTSMASAADAYAEAARANAGVFERHPYLVARPKASVSVTERGLTISTTPAHTRATGRTPASASAVRVAVVGGSTTFGTRVTDADSWPWLLQEQLGDGFAVVNYGVPGYTTAENIIQMALLVPETRPRIVVFYEGWNDIRNYHWPGFEPDYANHGVTQVDTLIPARRDRSTLWDRLARYSFVAGIVASVLGAPIDAAAAPPSRAGDPEVDRIYLRNLHTLRALARRFGMTALFVPQVINEPNFVATGVSRSWTPYIEDAAVPGLLRAFNALMAGVCEPGSADCVFVDEPLSTAWDGNDFVDEGHLSRRGGEKLASIVAARVRRAAAAASTASE
jgi:GDSL-like Lipase/Acylhydrolase family